MARPWQLETRRLNHGNHNRAIIIRLFVYRKGLVHGVRTPASHPREGFHLPAPPACVAGETLAVMLSDTSLRYIWRSIMQVDDTLLGPGRGGALQHARDVL